MIRRDNHLDFLSLRLLSIAAGLIPAGTISLRMTRTQRNLLQALLMLRLRCQSFMFHHELNHVYNSPEMLGENEVRMETSHEAFLAVLAVVFDNTNMLTGHLRSYCPI
jgi:hypothetical protein